MSLDRLLDALTQVGEVLLQIPLQLGALGLAIFANLESPISCKVKSGPKQRKIKSGLWQYLVEFLLSCDHLINIDFILAGRLILYARLARCHFECIQMLTNFPNPVRRLVVASRRLLQVRSFGISTLHKISRADM